MFIISTRSKSKATLLKTIVLAYMKMMDQQRSVGNVVLHLNKIKPTVANNLFDLDNNPNFAMEKNILVIIQESNTNKFEVLKESSIYTTWHIQATTNWLEALLEDILVELDKNINLHTREVQQGYNSILQSLNQEFLDEKLKPKRKRRQVVEETDFTKHNRLLDTRVRINLETGAFLLGRDILCLAHLSPITGPPVPSAALQEMREDYLKCDCSLTNLVRMLPMKYVEDKNVLMV